MKTMLVTGAGAGLGASIAMLADQAGYRVGVLDVSFEAAQATANTLTNGLALEGDVTNSTAIEDALSLLGQIDVLVNNAGILRTDPLISHSVEDFRLVVDVHLTGTFIAAQAAAKRMREANGGSIINMASINGMHPSPNCGAYAAAKAGIMALTQQMSIEWGQFGIRVNAIAPGFIDAGMSAPFYENQTVREKRGNAVPLGRLGNARDVAQSVLFLASDEADYISGQTIAVDGGVVNSVLAHLPRD